MWMKQGKKSFMFVIDIHKEKRSKKIVWIGSVCGFAILRNIQPKLHTFHFFLTNIIITWGLDWLVYSNKRWGCHKAIQVGLSMLSINYGLPASSWHGMEQRHVAHVCVARKVCSSSTYVLCLGGIKNKMQRSYFQDLFSIFSLRQSFCFLHR